MGAVSTPTREQVHDANLRLHQALAGEYDQIHPHMRNAYEQGLQRDDIARMHRDIAAAPGVRSVLDIGCGTGNLTLQFLAAGWSVTALDLSAAMLEIVRTKVEAAGVPAHRCTLVRSDVDTFLSQAPGRETAEYQVVAMSSVAHHLYDYLGSLEQLGARVAAEGFLYLIHEPVHQRELAMRFRPLRRVWSVVPRGLDRLGRLLTPRGQTRVWAEQDTTLVDLHYHRDGISVISLKQRLTALGFELLSLVRYNAHETSLASWLDNRAAPALRYEQFQRTYFRAIFKRVR